MTELVKQEAEAILQEPGGRRMEPLHLQDLLPFLSPCPAVRSVICLFACQKNVFVGFVLFFFPPPVNFGADRE